MNYIREGKSYMFFKSKFEGHVTIFRVDEIITPGQEFAGVMISEDGTETYHEINFSCDDSTQDVLNVINLNKKLDFGEIQARWMKSSKKKLS